MASDRTRELAEKWLEKHGQKNSNIQVLAELLDAFERETRLDEAKDWLVIVENLLKHKKHDALANRVLSECRQRVEDLAAPRQPGEEEKAT